MKKYRYIPGHFLPAKPPTLATVVYPTALHYWNAPGWAFGVIYALLFIGWLAFILWLFNAEKITKPPFEEPL